MTKPMHALVVGGTGMLRGACLELARRGVTVSIVARRHAPLASLAAEAARLDEAGAINPLPVDYHDSGELAARIRGAKAAHGPIELVIAWIHSSGREAHVLIGEMAASGPLCRYFQLLPHAMAMPEPDLEQIPGLLPRCIRLGFVIEPGGSRWLTDAEIARGTIEAVDRDAPEHIIGVIEPWSSRP